MRAIILRIAFIVLFFFFSASLVQAANSLDVVINEIAWMGTQASYNDEWIELYNSTNSPVDLSGWQLIAVDGTPEINLAGTVPANGFYLLERTDDTTISDVTADQIYTGALGNDGEHLKLFDAQDNLIDEVNCSGGWFGGDNLTKQTMERKSSFSSGSDPENWQTGQSPGGTPKNQNSTGQPQEPECEPAEEICDNMDNDCDNLVDENLGETTCGIGACEATITNCINGATQACTPGLPADEICDQTDNDCDGQIDENGICETPEPELEPQTTPTIYPSGIFINEFLPSPEGPDDESEWIELYNDNSFLINLYGWSIEDTQGSIKLYTFPESTTIIGYNFLILNRSASKITLNNDGEGLVLKNPLGKLVGSANYDGNAPEGQSYARKNNSTWQWTLSLTPGAENRFAPPTETETEAENKPESYSQNHQDPQAIEGLQQEQDFQVQPVPEGQEESKITAYPSGIVINEFLPSPAGSDSEEEWIELYNQNNFVIDLFGWRIQDVNGKIKIYNFPQGSKIGPYGFLILPRVTTQITLNNDEDELVLTQPNNSIADQVSYDKAPTGSSFNKIDSIWVWSESLTPGAKNIIPTQISEKSEEESRNSPEGVESGLAAIGKRLQGSSPSFLVLSLALAIAIFSGLLILFLKKQIKSE